VPANSAEPTVTAAPHTADHPAADHPAAASSSTPARLLELFGTQRDAFARDPIPSLAVRQHRLARLGEMVRAHRAEFRAALIADFGAHHPWLSDGVEMGWALRRVRHISQQLPHWLVARDVPLERVHGTSRAEMIQVPKGVNGIVAPWNTPLGGALTVAADVIAAGNPAIILPSDLTPACAQVLQQAVEAYCDPAVLAVVGAGSATALEFAAMPWAHLTYTGEASVGRRVAEIAGRNLVPVTLQLGGKNPAVFAVDGVTAELVQRFLSFRTAKAGQLSLSPDHVFVPRAQLELFTRLAEGIWRTAYPAHVGHPDATGLVNDRHYQRVLGHLAEARARGVTLVPLNDDQPDPVLRQLPTTLVIDPPDDLGCMTEEVLGPVIPVIPYDEFGDVIRRINAGPSPFAAYLATFECERVERFVAHVRCGGVGINTFGMQALHPALAVGGIGASGHGAQSGRDGFQQYTHTKTVFHAGADSVLHLALLPPVSELAGHVADAMLDGEVLPAPGDSSAGGPAGHLQ
jgi:coniferyl-aldehyde dehydrogenase